MLSILEKIGSILWLVASALGALESTIFLIYEFIFRKRKLTKFNAFVGVSGYALCGYSLGYYFYLMNEDVQLQYVALGVSLWCFNVTICCYVCYLYFRTIQIFVDRPAMGKVAFVCTVAICISNAAGSISLSAFSNNIGLLVYKACITLSGLILIVLDSFYSYHFVICIRQFSKQNQITNSELTIVAKYGIICNVLSIVALLWYGVFNQFNFDGISICMSVVSFLVETILLMTMMMKVEIDKLHDNKSRSSKRSTKTGTL